MKLDEFMEKGKPSVVQMNMHKQEVGGWKPRKPFSMMRFDKWPWDDLEEHRRGWHYGYITCSCGWAWNSMDASGMLDTAKGLAQFNKHIGSPVVERHDRLLEAPKL